MLKINSHNLGIQSGSVVLFSDYEHDGEMWAGHGTRSLSQIITFPETFIRPPVVQLSVSLWDFDSDTNQRADLSSRQITASGFEMVFSTWGDTRIARMRVDWMAFGEVKGEDDWELY